MLLALMAVALAQPSDAYALKVPPQAEVSGRRADLYVNVKLPKPAARG